MRGDFQSFGHFAFYFAINPHNLPNWKKLCTIQLYKLLWNIPGRHWFWGKKEQFSIYPLNECYWRAIKQRRAIYEPMHSHLYFGKLGKSVTCVSCNKGKFSELYTIFLFKFFQSQICKNAISLMYCHVLLLHCSFLIIYRIMNSCFIFNGFCWC